RGGNPSIYASRDRRCKRRSTECVSYAPAIGPGGIGGSDDKQQSCCRTERVWVAFRDVGRRKIAVKPGQLFRHALLVFAPQRVRKRVLRCASQTIRLRRDRGMRELVRSLDAPINLGARRHAEGASRNQAC